MKNEKIKYIIKTILKGLVLLLAFLFVLKQCGGCDNNIEIVKSDNTQYFAKMKSDSLFIVCLMEKQYQDSLKSIASKHSEDSLKTIADKYTNLYRVSAKKVRELIALGICDTVVVKTVLNDCDSTIKSKDSLIAQKDSTNKSVNEELITAKEINVILKSDVSTAKTIIKNLSGDYKELEKESKKSLRKQKFKTIGVIILATITEVLTIFALK